MHEDGRDTIQLDLPAVLTVVKDINQPRVPTLKGRLASRKAEIPVWTAETVGANPATLGLNGSPTRVVKTNPPPPRLQATTVIEGTPQACARQIVHELRMKSLI